MSAALIPAELRTSPLVISGRRVAQMAGAGRVTVGWAAVGSGVSLVEGGGQSVAGAPGVPVALAVTRLTSRDGRVYGVPCSGSGAAQSNVGGKSMKASAGGMVAFSMTEASRVSITGSMDSSGGFSWEGNAKLISNNNTYPVNFWLVNQVWDVQAGAKIQLFGGRYGVALTLQWTTTYDWRPAVAALRWVQTGLPWWGTIEAAARAGRWVRRESWSDQDRAIRYEPGAGTTRAVAVRESGGRVATEDFGAGEFLANDWLLVDAGEPAPVDVTDWVFSGPAGAVAFAVGGSGAIPGASPGSDIESPPPSCSLTVTGAVREAILAATRSYEADPNVANFLRPTDTKYVVIEWRQVTNPLPSGWNFNGDPKFPTWGNNQMWRYVTDPMGNPVPEPGPHLTNPSPGRMTTQVLNPFYNPGFAKTLIDNARARNAGKMTGFIQSIVAAGGNPACYMYYRKLIESGWSGSTLPPDIFGMPVSDPGSPLPDAGSQQGLPALPPTGDHVLVSKNRSLLWEPVRDF